MWISNNVEINVLNIQLSLFSSPIKKTIALPLVKIEAPCMSMISIWCLEINQTRAVGDNVMLLLVVSIQNDAHAITQFTHFTDKD